MTTIPNIYIAFAGFVAACILGYCALIIAIDRRETDDLDRADSRPPRTGA